MYSVKLRKLPQTSWGNFFWRGTVSGKSLLKGLISAFLGMLVATVGMDEMTGVTRLAFGSMNLIKGFSLIPLLIGLFAIPEILIYVEEGTNKTGNITNDVIKVSQLKEDNRVSFKEFRLCIKSILRSTAIGTFLGAMPGIGSAIAAFFGYGIAKQTSKHPEKFGKGELEGVAAAEAANNAVSGATFIPLLTLGIPGDTVTAVMIGAFLIQGLIPGAHLFKENPGEVYGLFIALLVGNVANYLIGNISFQFLPRLFKVSKSIAFPIIVVLCSVGAYAVGTSMFDVKVMVFFGLFGYFLRKFKFPVPPFLLAFVLSPMIESAFKQSLLMSRGTLSIFILRPISAVVLFVTIISLVAMTIIRYKKKDTVSISNYMNMKRKRKEYTE